jgi:predicted component of type VI protein secretion system
MLLALSIISEHGAALGPTAYKVFDERGGSIGRINGNDWVLPDPQNFVSSKHARVLSRGGVFYLEDTSSNGTFINAPDQPASRTEPVPLNDGDRLFIGDYEIIVQLIPSGPSDAANRPAAQAPPPALAPTQLNAVPAPPPVPPGVGLGTVDPLAALGGARSQPRMPPPPSASVVPVTPASSTPAGAADLLTALGVDPSRVDPAIQQQLGQILRLTVHGLVDVLKSRAEVKNSFRLPTTSIKPVENNPLKFSMNAEDAIHNLFVKRNPGYLGPVESFEEGFADASHHQAAVLAGIRAAFNAMLAKFHPTHLEEMYERKLRRTAMLGLGNKLKYWEMYRTQFEEIDRDREASFQTLFGEEFAQAYNEHFQKLAADARLRKPR